MSEPKAIDETFRDLIRSVAEDLKSLGLKRKGTSFLADFGPTFGVAVLQKDKYNDATRIRFTFNCGGGSELLYKAVPLGFPAFKKEYGICPFMRRAGWSTKEDLWWEINLETADFSAIRESIVKRFREETLPYLSIFKNDETIFEQIQDPEFVGLPDRIRERYIEAYRRRGFK